MSLRDWLPEGHLANFVVDRVDEIDISSIERAIQSKDSRGTRPYVPRVMVALLVYAYATGVFSSRRIARACVENVAFRVISRDQQPFFTVIAEFRRTHLAAFSALFVEVLRLCREAGLVKGRDVHLDGTKLQANASRRKAMSYAGMKQAEERLSREIEELLARAKRADAEEDALDPDPPAPPAADAMPEHAPATQPEGTPRPEAQRNFTDGDSRIMMGEKGAYEQCFNGQVVVDQASHVILAEGLSNQAPDSLRRWRRGRHRGPRRRESG